MKLLPAAEMAQARAFQQGLNRATKAEEKFNRNYARNDARNTQRGDRRGGKGTSGYNEDYPTLSPVIGRKGEIKHHAANEKKMRKMPAQDFDEDGWGWIGEDDGKAAQNGRVDEQSENTTAPSGNARNQNASTTVQNSHSRSDPNFVPPHKRAVQNRYLKEPKKTVNKDTEDGLTVRADKPKETPLPPQRLMARLHLLDAYEDDADGGVPLI